jgi:hypothetical protein
LLFFLKKTVRFIYPFCFFLFVLSVSV